MVRGRYWQLLAVGLVTNGAFAQGLDLHGDVPPPSRAGQPVSVWSAATVPEQSWSFGVLAEAASAPLVVEFQRAGSPEPEVAPVVDDLLLANVHGLYGVTSRVSVGASLPVFFGATTASLARSDAGDFRIDTDTMGALGDLHFWAPVRLSSLQDDVRTVSFVPSLAVPTGASARNLGDRWPRVGAMVVGSLNPERGFTTHGNLGFSLRRSVNVAFGDLVQARLGGPSVNLGAAAGWRFGSALTAQLETRVNWFLFASQPVFGNAADRQGTDPERRGLPPAPAEVLASLGGAVGARLGWSAGIGGGVGRAIGSPEARLFLGVHARSKPPARVTNAVDPTVKAVPSSGVDSSPSLPAVTEVTLRVQDERGRPIEGAVSATGADGQVVRALASESLTLDAGTWDISVQAPGFGVQSRRVEVDGRGEAQIDVVLAALAGEAVLARKVVDADGRPVSGAAVLIDGRPVGTTGSGGWLQVAGLGDGEHELEVQHPDFTTATRALPADALVADAPLVLRRVPGTVRVRVLGPDRRPVPDASLRFGGPRALPPVSVGDGEHIQVLGPGDWMMLVSSPTYGVQQRELRITEDDWQVVEVDVLLQPEEAGEALLNVRIVDALGAPVTGVNVALDGQDLGTTSTGGVMTLAGLSPGARRLTVQSPWLRPSAPRDVVIAPGEQEVVVDIAWLPGLVDLSVRGPNGPLDDARVLVGGPQTVPSPTLGVDGRVRLQLPPGTWTLAALSPSLGVQQREVIVAAESVAIQRVEIALLPAEGGLADLGVRVLDPDGLPVSGALVRVDGTSLGTTSLGGLAVDGLAVGRRTLEVTSPRYAPYNETIQLLEGKQEHDVPLKWAPGTVAFVVTGPRGRRVTDAVVRAVGPAAVPPLAVDANGEAIVQLGVGAWQALVVSPQLGMAEIAFDIDERDVDLRRVPVRFELSPSAATSLMVRVLDTSGAPVIGASVVVGGQTVMAGPGGAALVGKLRPGPATLSATAPGYAPGTPLATTLVAGAQERVLRLEAVAGRVPIRVVDTSGAPVDAELRFVGETEAASQRTGATGELQALLAPGTWQVIAQAGDLGPARATVSVARGEVAAPVTLKLSTSRVDIQRSTVALREQVLFAFGSVRLSDRASPALDEVAAAILALPNVQRVEVQGHTDGIGGVAYNQTLSQQRAEVVRRALVSRGVPPEQVIARGYGAQRPVALDDTEAARARNRRVVFELVGASPIDGR